MQVARATRPVNLPERNGDRPPVWPEKGASVMINLFLYYFQNRPLLIVSRIRLRKGSNTDLFTFVSLRCAALQYKALQRGSLRFLVARRGTARCGEGRCDAMRRLSVLVGACSCFFVGVLSCLGEQMQKKGRVSVCPHFQKAQKVEGVGVNDLALSC